MNVILYNGSGRVIAFVAETCTGKDLGSKAEPKFVARSLFRVFGASITSLDLRSGLPSGYENGEFYSPLSSREVRRIGQLFDNYSAKQGRPVVAAS